MRLCLFALFVLATVLGLTGCQSSAPGGRTPGGAVPVLDPGAARAAGLSAEDVHNAAGLYVGKCARCHKFYHPADYTDAEWSSWMTKMSRKARLKPEQQEMLARYLGAFRTTPSGKDKPDPPP